ncbi:MAG: retropepsin-like domain-containing protein [Bacteroidaceae bacterium]|nr:retropepsin-like domain-containing protein [Bacteroidaceae bacterium]
MKRILLLLILYIGVITAQAFRMETPYVEENGKLLTRASVNGVEGVFVIDTGAPCAVTYSFAERAGLKSLQASRAYDSNGNIVQTSIVNIDRFLLGGVTFSSLQAMRLEKGNMTESFGIDGIIGYNLLRQGIVKFNGSKRTMIITNDTTGLGMNPNYAICMVQDPMLTLLSVRIGQVVDTVMFDSGAVDYYEMCTKSYNRMKDLPETSLVTLGSGKGILSMGAAGVESASWKARLKAERFFLGNIPYKNVTTITTDAFDSRIGSAWLHLGDVIIDFKNEMFYFQPYNSEQPRDLYQPEWNVVVVAMNGGLAAGMVWDDGGSGIEAGDPIVAIGSQRVDKIDLRTATTQGGFDLRPDGTQITFLNRRTGKEEQMKIFMK